MTKRNKLHKLNQRSKKLQLRNQKKVVKAAKNKLKKILKNLKGKGKKYLKITRKGQKYKK